MPSAESVAPDAALIAIVTAYNTPNAEADLAVYRAQFGLPPCHLESGCFERVGQTGQKLFSKSLANLNPAWNGETLLDLEMASAACPGCRLLLIQANSTAFGDLSDATVVAASYHPAAISESWGRTESASTRAYDFMWNHPGIPIVAATGDSSAPTFPATSKYVIAVGGTMWRGGDRQESTWSGGGAGCSINDALPPWQTNSYGCSTRGVGDVLALAAGSDGQGAATYNSVTGGWSMMIGTSVAAPIIAGAFAAAHDYPADGVGAASLYAKAQYLRTVPNANYGLGVPNGLAAF
ncbi:MAG: S8 family serine peptidase [Candidatus Velthaea sp.]